MSFPEDEQSRRVWLAAQWEDVKQRTKDNIGPPSRLAQRLMSDAVGNGTAGWYAGAVFRNLINLKLHDSRNASVAKAQHLLFREMEGAYLRNGQKAPCSLRAIKGYWSEFRTVAHFWAAHNLTMEEGFDLGAKLGWEELDVKVVFILSAADLLLRVALEHDAPIGQGHWVLPEGCPLLPLSIGVPSLTEWAAQRLGEYRAPTSAK
jgi:hypothetical protein